MMLGEAEMYTAMWYDERMSPREIEFREKLVSMMYGAILEDAIKFLNEHEAHEFSTLILISYGYGLERIMDRLVSIENFSIRALFLKKALQNVENIHFDIAYFLLGGFFYYHTTGIESRLDSIEFRWPCLMNESKKALCRALVQVMEKYFESYYKEEGKSDRRRYENFSALLDAVSRGQPISLSRPFWGWGLTSRYKELQEFIVSIYTLEQKAGTSFMKEALAQFQFPKDMLPVTVVPFRTVEIELVSYPKRAPPDVTPAPPIL